MNLSRPSKERYLKALTERPAKIRAARLAKFKSDLAHCLNDGLDSLVTCSAYYEDKEFLIAEAKKLYPWVSLVSAPAPREHVFLIKV